MSFLPNIPAAGDNISVSQGNLQSNFQYLGNTTGSTANGYYKLPNGLIVQWGRWTGSSTINGVAVTFAGNFVGCIAFPTNCFSLILQPVKTSTVPHAFFLSGSSVTKTGFTVSTDTTWGNGYYFFAIGN